MERLGGPLRRSSGNWEDGETGSPLCTNAHQFLVEFHGVRLSFRFKHQVTDIDTDFSVGLSYCNPFACCPMQGFPLRARQSASRTQEPRAGGARGAGAGGAESGRVRGLGNRSMTSTDESQP